MSMLNSPLEALAIGYLSYGLLTAVSNIWAWVAVITTAIGFWRIKGLSFPPHLIKKEVSPLESSSYLAETAAEPDTVSSTTEKHLLPASLTTTMSDCVLDSECSPKGKFSVYYKDDFKNRDEGGDDDSDGVCNGGEGAERAKLGWRCCEWERTMVVRMGDLGWHRYQDLTVLDGSVVRLWDSRWR
ncbi:hypothetical protein OROGR_029706 [Orobanche gracilis]